MARRTARGSATGALGYSVFAYVAGFETRPVRVRIEGPPTWPVYSTLAPRVSAASGGLTATSTPDDEARVVFNVAHHISHAWVPKRACGPGYFPFSWELAPVLDTIWFAEGFGQYAAIMALAPAMADPQAYRRAC